jgi:ankyrin repeat protein
MFGKNKLSNFVVHITLTMHVLQACIDDNLDMVEFLVKHGADVNKGDNEGWTPLHATASCGFISIAKYVSAFLMNLIFTFTIPTCRIVEYSDQVFQIKKKC